MVLGRYELLLPIAQGGMATVWAARLKGSRGFQKTVAIKTMLPSLSDDPQFEQMFLDEASLASRIHHPNVAEILDLGEQDEVLYLVMEWVDGEALSVVHRAAKRTDAIMPQRIALRIVGQACAGLHAAHELKDENDAPLQLVHRDVSPQNILVTYDGIVKVVDFGVAKALGRVADQTTAGQLKGKVPYMSPEQARGGQVDRRTDVFAMGIVLYKLATGLHPFLGDNDMVTMRNIISRPVLSPRARNPGFSPELEQVLMKCLHKDPDRRYPTIADVDRAIDRVLAVTGASVVDDDVGSFVRATLGDRGQKRRAALRDAVRTADERAAGIALVPGPAPAVHDGISEVLITKLGSGVMDEMVPDRISQFLGHSGAGYGSSPPEPGSSSVGPPSSYLPPRSRSPIALLLFLGGSAFVIVVIGFFVWRSLSKKTPSGPTAAVASLPAPAPSPSAAPVIATAVLSASAPPDVVVSVNDLPSTDKAGRGGKRTGAPKEDDKPAASATPADKVPSKQWVPSVRQPGF